MLNSISHICGSELSRFWFDDAFDPEERARLHAVLAGHEHHYDAGSVLKCETDESQSIFVMLRGWAALSKSLPEGQTQIIDFSMPGDFFNLASADGKTAVIGFEAITDATVAIVPIKEWIELEKHFPQMAQVVQKQAAATRSRISERMLRLGRGNAEERLAYAFLELGIRTGSLHDDTIECFHMPITQQQLGNFMGLTSVHVCRTLRRMVRNGFISTSDHIDLCVLDTAALEDLAGISSATLAQEITPTG